MNRSVSLPIPTLSRQANTESSKISQTELLDSLLAVTIRNAPFESFEQ
jgi:hypothetical protein